MEPLYNANGEVIWSTVKMPPKWNDVMVPKWFLIRVKKIHPSLTVRRNIESECLEVLEHHPEWKVEGLPDSEWYIVHQIVNKDGTPRMPTERDVQYLNMCIRLNNNEIMRRAIEKHHKAKLRADMERHEHTLENRRRYQVLTGEASRYVHGEKLENSDGDGRQ